MIARPRRPPVQPTAKVLHFPAPSGGINAITDPQSLAPQECPLAKNVTPWIFGLRQRSAYTAYSSAMTGAGGNNEVRSIFPFNGSNSTGTQDKLFAALLSGIWDATTATQVATYGTQTGDAGYGTCAAFNTSADRYLVVTDEVNGLWVYTQSTNAWAAVAMGGGAGQISGVDPTTFVHVTVFKNRLWFTQKNTTLAWYMGTNALFGAATSFDFGPRFAHGGDLRGLFNWSYDGGSGIDTLLVGVSGGGDIVIYQGTDPTTAASFSLKGTWFAGGVPPGRQLATSHGGDLLVMSARGLLPLSKLTTGSADIEASQYSTYKISTWIAFALASFGIQKGWFVRACPMDNTILLNIPLGSSPTSYQYAMSMTNHAWTQYGRETTTPTTCLGYPMLCGETWNGALVTANALRNTFYFGSTDGKVYRLNAFNGFDLTSTAIECEVITYSTTPGSNLHKAEMIKPRFMLRAAPVSTGTVVNAAVRFDGDQTEVAALTLPTVADTTGAPFVQYTPVIGATGIGNAMAVCVRWASMSPVMFSGVDVVYQDGGFL